MLLRKFWIIQSKEIFSLYSGLSLGIAPNAVYVILEKCRQFAVLLYISS